MQRCDSVALLQCNEANYVKMLFICSSENEAHAISLKSIARKYLYLTDKANIIHCLDYFFDFALYNTLHLLTKF